MKAFVVSQNGQHVCTAGIGGADVGVLSAHVTLAGRETVHDLSLSVGGLDSETDEHLRWVRLPLSIGDEVTIRIVDAATVDPPRERFPVKRRENLT